MNVSYEGIGYLAVTMPCDTAVAGQLCMLNAAGQVDKCEEGKPFIGFVEAVEDGKAAVQIGGAMEVGFTGSIPPAGYTKLSSNGQGGVKVDTTGREYMVLCFDSIKSTVMIKL